MPVVDIIIRTIDQSGGDVGKLTGKLGELATKYLSVGAVAAAAYKVIDDSIKTTLDYANSVRQLSQISGESTEETSRFIQVLDDYKITAADALVATRSLTKEGHTPSIQTLAQLSDEYLSLNSAEEKNEFILKNLGRGGLQWVEVLNKGSKALLEQGDAVSQALILSQKQVDAARRNEIATDNWNDSIQGLKISIGNELLPVMTDFINDLNASQRAQEILAEQGKGGAMVWSKEYADAVAQAKEEQKLATDAMMENAKAADTLTNSIQMTNEELKSMTEANQSMIGLIGDMQSAEDSYQENAKKLNEERIQIENDRAAAIAQGWWTGSEKIKEYDQDLLENTAQVQANEAEHDRANKEIISGLVERKLMQDGVLDDKEFEWLLKKRQEWGLYSSDVVEKARAAWKEADRITASVANIPSSKTITITTNYVETHASLAGQGGLWSPIPHASGGMFTIPQGYGNEGFRLGNGDTASGGEKLAIAPEGKDFIDYKRIGAEMEKAYMRAAMKSGG